MFGRIARLVNYKVILYAFVAVALLFAVLTPRIMDPLLNFCFGGVVPGTDHVLAPDVIMLGATAIVGLLVVWMLLLWLLRIRRVRRVGQSFATARTDTKEHIIFSRETAIPVPAVSQKSLKTTKVAHVTSLERPRVSAFGSGMWLHLTGWMLMLSYVVVLGISALYIGVRTLLRAAGNLVIIVSQFIKRISRRAAAGILRFCKALLRSVLAVGMKTFVIAVIVGELLIAVIRTTTRKVWIWLEPRASKFDTWLEIQCRAFIKLVNKKLSRYDGLVVMKTIVRETKNNLRNLLKFTRW